MAYKLSKDLTKKPYYQNAIIKAEEKVNKEENTNKEESDNVSEEDENIVVSVKDYVNVIKKVKKDNITPDNIGEIMLCQIPGISSVTALAVMEKYQSIPNLIKELEKNSECLKDLSYTNSKGQTRKISKTCIVNIIKFLLKK